MRTKIIAAICAASLLAGCANIPAPEPVVDMGGVDPAKYQFDLAQCREYAAKVDPAKHAAAGAVAGAIFGALLGAAIGGGRGAAFGAEIGGIEGGASGVAHGAVSQDMIMKRCMAGRGYSVLN